jgi:manganese/zinc/iron transport system permease protein
MDYLAPFAVIVGAFISSLLALKLILFLQDKEKVSADTALCFTLALFFGIGIVAVSSMQVILPLWHKYTQMFLFGQPATMTDVHIFLYGALACLVVFFVWLYFYPLQASLFDRNFSLSIGIKATTLERLTFWLLLLSLIVGIRSVGVVLMSGMLIAPAVAARQFTHSLSRMFILAAVFGVMSGLIGNGLSILGSSMLSSIEKPMTLPTGPMIVLSGSFFAFVSLFFAPKQGLFFRKYRAAQFRLRCLEENILKCLWKRTIVSSSDLTVLFGIRRIYLFFVLRRLLRHGWVMESENHLYTLTSDGRKKSARIVRLHRLWELYLADTLKLNIEKVHKTAEEMEHILTPDLEERLTCLLENPSQDPHLQPIPKRSETV